LIIVPATLDSGGWDISQELQSSSHGHQVKRSIRSSYISSSAVTSTIIRGCKSDIEIDIAARKDFSVALYRRKEEDIHDQQVRMYGSVVAVSGWSSKCGDLHRNSSDESAE
jgi:hypothetical protein